MKNTIFCMIAFMVMCFSTAAQTTRTAHIKTKVDSVIVYLDGAAVMRSSAIDLSTGRNELVFSGLSSKIDEKSIRLFASGEVSVLSITSRIDYLTNVKEQPKITRLKDSLELVKQKIIALSDEKNALTTELQMLLKNESIGGEQQGLSISELRQAADFFRSRVLEINRRMSEINRNTTEYGKTASRLNKQLTESNAQYNYQRGEVIVLLSSEKQQTCNILLSYIIGSAGWAPSYDLVATDVGQPIVLKYRAKVFNNSGIDWKNIHLKLSSGDPGMSASKPMMTPWYLNYNSTGKSSLALSQGYVQQLQYDEYDESKHLEAYNTDTTGSKYKEIAVSELSAEFSIKTSYNIPSDDKPYLVEVDEYKLPATYKHFAIPKVDRDVFLLARITGWEDLWLIEGPANVFYNGTYVGRSYIYTRSTNDTLDLSLGRDKKVVATRVKSKEFNRIRIIGSSRKEFFSYEMVIKNNRRTSIQIEIQDQVPISQHSDIEVELIEDSEATRDDNKGKLCWLFNIEPGGQKQIKLAFSVKYPKNKPVQLERMRRKSARFL